MQSNTPEGKDEVLWELAKKRSSFKTHLFTYIIINIFLWGIWYFSGNNFRDDRFPWAVWTTLGWGLGVAFHFAGAYIFHNSNSVEKEYQKLKNKN